MRSEYKKEITNNKLLKNGLYYVLGGILLQGINFFTLPIFTRLLSVEDFGMISIYNTWLNIVAIFICFQSNGSIGNAKITYDENEFEDYVLNILILSTVIFCFWLIVFVLCKNYLIKVINLSDNIIFIMLIHSFFYTIIILKTTIYIFQQKASKKLCVSFVQIFFSTVLSLILMLYFYPNNKYIGRIYGMSIITTFLGLYFYIGILRKKCFKINFKYWKFCLLLTIPLVFHSISGMILGSSDRIMLEKFRNFEEVGLYSFIYDFGIIITMLFGAMNSAWGPWYYENLQQNNNKLIRKYAVNYLNFFTIVCVGFLMLAPEIIKIMGPEKYWSGLKVLPLIVLGCYFNFLYSFSVNYQFYLKKTKYIALGTTMAAIVNFILNLYFIPKYGWIGGALTTLVSYFCLFLFHEVIVRVKFKYKVLLKREYLFQITLNVIFSLMYYVFIDEFLIRVLILFFLGIIYSFYLYKKLKNVEEV